MFVNNIALPVLWDALLHSIQATNNIRAAIRGTLAQIKLPEGFRLLEMQSEYRGPAGIPGMGNEQFIFCVPEDIEFPEFKLWHTDKIHAHGDLRMMPPDTCFKLVLQRGEWYPFNYEQEYPASDIPSSPTEFKEQPKVDNEQPVTEDIVSSEDNIPTNDWKLPPLGEWPEEDKKS